MAWIDYVLLVNAAAIVIVVGLFISSLKGIKERLSHHAFLGILIGQIVWSFSDALSALLAVRYGYFSELLGTMSGLAVIGIALSTFLFCEFFGAEDRKSRGRRLRLILALAGSLVCALMTFSERFITGRQVTDGVRSGLYGPYFVAVGAFVALLVLVGVGLLLSRAWRARDPRTRTQLRMFALAVALTLVLAFSVTYILPLLGDFRFDFAGPPSFVVFVSIALYTILFHEFVDLKRAYALWGLHMIVGGLAIGALVFVLWGLLSEERFALSLGLFFAVSLVFGVGLIYQEWVVPRLRRWIQGADPDLTGTMVALFSAVETTSSGRDAYLGRWLETLTERLRLIDACLVIPDERGGEQIVTANGRRLSAVSPRLMRLLERRLPGALRTMLDAVISTERERLPALPEGFQRRHPLSAAIMDEFRKAAAGAGYPLIVPLLNGERLEALLLPGRKRSGRLYYEKDLRLLGALRLPLAAALRKVNEQANLSASREQAEQIASSLSKFLFVTERIDIDENHALVFRSGLMEEIVQQTRLFAGRDNPVLILGETGTGKELIARILHQSGPNADQPFVAINCAAMPDGLWEDELFGHLRGAFTDARENREGKLAEAGRGTIFLDEVGELPPATQSRLLRVLQERTYSPLGSDKVKQARCRFIFATNRDLLAMTRDGGFREDLYYRINVLEIKLPPLRERLSDVPVIARHVLDGLAAPRGEVPGLSEAALRRLVEHPWPGNVRELQNVIVRAATLAGGRNIEVDDLALGPAADPAPASSLSGAGAGGSGGPGQSLAVLGDGNYREAVEAFRRSLIVRALHESGGNKTRAAELLKIKRTTLNSHMKELGITF